MILITTFGEYPGEKPYIEGLPRLPHENTDFAHIVVNRVNTPVDALTNLGIARPIRISEINISATNTQDFIPILFPNPDFFVPGDFTLGPRSGCGVNWLVPGPLISTDSNSRQQA